MVNNDPQYQIGYADGYRAREEEIVLCIECRKGDPGKIFDVPCVWCRLDGNPKKVNNFCGYAERRE